MVLLGDARSILISIPNVSDFINSGYISKIKSSSLKDLFLVMEKLRTFSSTLDQYANNQLNSHITPYFIEQMNIAQFSSNKRMITLNPIQDFSSFVNDRKLENLLNMKIDTDTSKLDFSKTLSKVLDLLEIEIKKELNLI